jgi:hypothetical protein
MRQLLLVVSDLQPILHGDQLRPPVKMLAELIIMLAAAVVELIHPEVALAAAAGVALAAAQLQTAPPIQAAAVVELLITMAGLRLLELMAAQELLLFAINLLLKEALAAQLHQVVVITIIHLLVLAPLHIQADINGSFCSN